MGVQQDFYSADGQNKTFPSTKHIATKQHMAVWLRQSADAVEVQLDSSKYELITNAAVLNTAPSVVIYDRIEIRVADSLDELTSSPSDISIVANISEEVVIVAGIEDEVVIVAGSNTQIVAVGENIDDVVTVSGNLPNINTVAGISSDVTGVAAISSDVTAVNTEPLRQSILDAEVNATSANQSAVDANQSALDAAESETTSALSAAESEQSATDAANSAASIDPDTLLHNTEEAETKIGDLTIGETVSVSSWSYVATTITLNATTAHSLSVGDTFYVSGLVATTNAPSGTWTVVTVVDADTITFIAVDTPTGTPSVSSAFFTRGTLNLRSNVKIVDFGTVFNNNRYVIDNPFGNANYEGCIVRLQFFDQGKWFYTGSGDNASGVSYGSVVESMAEGIVVQTSLENIIAAQAEVGAHTLGVGATSSVSLPARVIVIKIGDATDA